MNEKILIVDDEQNILDGLKTILRNEFIVEIANGGEAGLRALTDAGPFAVVMSDMRMPGMDGIQFLRKVRERSPDSVRFMLTGNVDIQTAMDAVNEGSVFRFLTKPCASDVLKNALTAALHQYRLIVAERELLEKTLHGSIKVLTEVLSVVSPAAFGRAARVHRIVLEIVHQLRLPDAWSYELAAMLSQIGCMALDAETVEAMYAGADLPAAEQERFKMHPSIAYELVNKIPRLQTVAAMIAGQQGPASVKFAKGKDVDAHAANLGAEILTASIDYDQLRLSRLAHDEVIKALKLQAHKYNPDVLKALEHVPFEAVPMVYQNISIRELTVGMILDEDLRSPNGLLLVARNQEVSFPLLVRIRNFNQKYPIANKIRVKTVETEVMVLKGV